MRRTPSRMHQNGDADESKDDATRHHPVQSFVAGEMGDERHPERYRGHQQGGEPRRDELLAPAHTTVATGQQEATDDKRRSPVAKVGVAISRLARPERNRVQDRSSDQEAHPGHHQGRHRLHRNPDRQVRRSPNNVERQKSRGHQQRGAMTKRMPAWRPYAGCHRGRSGRHVRWRSRGCAVRRDRPDHFVKACGGRVRRESAGRRSVARRCPRATRPG